MWIWGHNCRSHLDNNPVHNSGSGPHPQDTVIEGSAYQLRAAAYSSPCTTCASRVEPRGKELVPPSSSPSGTCVFEHTRQVSAARDTASSHQTSRFRASEVPHDTKTRLPAAQGIEPRSVWKCEHFQTSIITTRPRRLRHCCNLFNQSLVFD